MAIVLISCPGANTPREKIKFTKHWKFNLSDNESYKEPGYDDSGWRLLNIPHDWSIESEFSIENPATPGGGALPGGIGWYRKKFSIPESDKDKLIFIDFDGVYMNSEVWVNGHSLGVRPYGYISFRYELTPYLNFGGENTIAVKVDNSEQPNSRWYSGSGIYRNVWLIKTEKLHIGHWGTFVTTPEINKKIAKVHIEANMKNDNDSDINCTLKTIIYNKYGGVVSETESDQLINANNNIVVTQELSVKKPKLWSISNPYLYKAVSIIFHKGKPIDYYETNFGIRYFNFDPDKGFSLNGEKMKLLGVCQHHDLGCLGAAINTRALERQLEILKEMGCNSIRTSHNPPAPEFLELCDKMGFIVQDETFDMWRKRKTQYDYSRYFAEWHERDLKDHILRDRNHPSVMMWSIGNEVLEQWDHVDADTLDIAEANFLLNFEKNVNESILASGGMPVNSLLTIKLANIVKSLDPTRPVTSGCNEVNKWNNLFKSGALDLYGFNYNHEYYKVFPENFPGKCLYISEATSGLMTRGFYQMPSDSIFIWPDSYPPSGKPIGNGKNQCSSYDNCHVPWGSTHEESWNLVKKYSHIAGTFIWTGFDYLGEPTPYWWPSRSSYFGIIDLAGFPKDIYYMYQSEWTDKDVLHVFPHWNIPSMQEGLEPGQIVDIWAYTNAEEVELFVNGKSLGAKSKEGDELHIMWKVPYEPGTIKAISRTKGKIILEKEIKTAGKASKLKLTADRAKINADGYDLSFITVEVQDEKGTLAPYASNQINFQVEGNAQIAGVDNGDPTNHEPMKGSSIKAFHGKCLVVIKAGEKKGNVILTASSKGLEKEMIKIKLK